MLKDFNIGNKNKAELYENAMNSLHEVARRNNVHIVGVVQSRRPDTRINITNVEQLERFRPHIEELKNSAAIEERSRTVISVFRKKHFAMRYLPQDPETLIMSDIAEIDILKQNMGVLGRIKYLFDPECYTFTKLVDEDEENTG
jgi:replicative DNA helicase